MKLRITLLALAVSALPLTAAAQAPAPAPGAKVPAWREACAAEIEKHCKEADKNNKTTDCLAEHEKDLGEDCTKRFLKGYKVSKICAGDFERLCKDAPSMGKCIQENDAKLSKECKAALVAGSKERRADIKAEAKEEAKAAKSEAKAAKSEAKAAKGKAKAAKKEEKEEKK